MPRSRKKVKVDATSSKPVENNDTLYDIAESLANLPDYIPPTIKNNESQPNPTQDEPNAIKPTNENHNKKIRETFSSLEEAVRVYLENQTLKFLRNFLKTEFNQSSSSLLKHEVVELLVKRICFSLAGDDNSANLQKAEELIKQANIIIETNLERFGKDETTKPTIVVSTNKEPILIEGFKTVGKIGYKQNSRSRQIQLVSNYMKKYNNNPPIGSQARFAMENNVTPSQFCRYLQKHKQGTLTLEVERGHRAPLLLTNQVHEVIDKLTEERQEKNQIDNTTTAKVIEEVSGKKPSSYYVSTFNKKFLFSRKIKTRMTIRERSESPYDQIYRTYYFYNLFASIMFRKFKVMDRDRIVVFDETGTNIKASESTKTPLKEDDGFVLQMKEETKDTFLVGVKASGKILPISIVKSVPGKYSTINGKRTTDQVKIAGVHLHHIKEWILNVYLPNSKEGDILMWDNLSHHLNPDIQKLLKQNNRLNMLLPLGGHHQSPLDNMIFRQAKRLLSKWKKDNIKATRDERNTAFMDIFRTLSDDIVINSFRKCNIDFWNYDTEDDYLRYVRKELKMNNNLYDLYCRQYNSSAIDQFYVHHVTKTTTKIENESLAEDLEPEVEDEHPFIDPESLMERFTQEQSEQFSSILMKMKRGKEFNETLVSNRKHLQVFVLTHPDFTTDMFTYPVINSLNNNNRFMNGNILDSFGIIMSKLSERYIQYIPSSFSQKLDDEVGARTVDYRKKLVQINITAKGYIIFPLSRNLHWHLFVYNCQTSEWKLFDSLSNNYTNLQEEVSSLFDLLPDFIIRPVNISKLIPTRIQHKKDGIHCGDFCVLFMELLSLGLCLNDICDFLLGDTFKEMSIMEKYRTILSQRLTDNFHPMTIQDKYADSDLNKELDDLLNSDIMDITL